MEMGGGYDFVRIANETLEKAKHVKCDFKEYVRGLRIINDKLREELELAEDEAKSKE